MSSSSHLNLAHTLAELIDPTPTSLWVAIATTCQGCGGDRAVRLFTQDPTPADLDALKGEVYGLDCVAIACFEAQPDGAAIVLKGDE